MTMTRRTMSFDQALESWHPAHLITHNLGSRDVSVSATLGGESARVRHEVLDENTVSVTAIDPLDVIVIRAPDFELSPATEPLGGTCTHERSVKERYLGADTGDRKCLGCGAIINIWREVVD